jgi:hypothetical protein
MVNAVDIALVTEFGTDKIELAEVGGFCVKNVFANDAAATTIPALAKFGP